MKMVSSMASQEEKNHHQHYYSTVGAVAIDKDGNVASAVSSGDLRCAKE
jgi:isoaspartyl peptidase/L-asparaginase-like protein (Ntn-hydrolase superfamily)